MPRDLPADHVADRLFRRARLCALPAQPRAAGHPRQPAVRRALPRERNGDRQTDVAARPGTVSCLARRDLPGPPSAMPCVRDVIVGPWRAVLVLGVTQILAWGAIFYPPVLTVPLIAAERGWSVTFAMGGFSLA